MTGSASDPRYARQVAFRPVGTVGQERLLASHVAVVGAGALGASIAEQLARSGIGHLTVIDRDVLEESNLGRQSLYTAEDAARHLPKSVALAAHLARFNPTITITPHVSDLTADTIDALIGGVDVIVDGTDNFETRYLVNDYAVTHGIPWVYGGCVAARGLSTVIIPGETACLRCVFRDPPPAGSGETCETSGILAPAATLIASLQVVEVLKLVCGARDRVRKSWLSVDLWNFRITAVGGEDPKPDPECPCCGLREFQFLEGGSRPRTITYCGRDSVQVVPGRRTAVDLVALAARLSSAGSVERNDFLLVLTVPPHVITVFEDGRALVRGTKDPAIARALYDRFVGS